MRRFIADLESALREAVWHDLATVLGEYVARELFLDNIGAVMVAHSLVGMGWWPGSPPASERAARVEYARSLRELATLPFPTSPPMP